MWGVLCGLGCEGTLSTVVLPQGEGLEPGSPGTPGEQGSSHSPEGAPVVCLQWEFRQQDYSVDFSS